MWKARGIDRSWKRRVGPPMISSKIDIKNNKLIPDSTHRHDSLYVCMMNAESPNQATWIIKIRPRESGDSGAGDVILGQYLAPFLVDRLRVGCRTLWTACAGSNHTGFIFRVTRTDFSSLHLSNYLSLYFPVGAIVDADKIGSIDQDGVCEFIELCTSLVLVDSGEIAMD